MFVTLNAGQSLGFTHSTISVTIVGPKGALRGFVFEDELVVVGLNLFAFDQVRT